MRDDERFLRSLLESPEDAAVRSAYANWLDERHDRRAEFVRINSDVERPSFVKSLRQPATQEYYRKKFPEIEPEWNEWQAQAGVREQVQASIVGIEPTWLAFMNSLGRPFQPFFFWNNTGPRSFDGPETPFTRQIGTRGWVVTFEDSFRQESSWDSGLMEDLRVLRDLWDDHCAYGAASCPVHPFICESGTERRPVTGRDVLQSLKARQFNSRYIETLDATQIPFPGYNPGDGTTIENDEIHTEFAEQNIFQKPEDRDENAPPPPSDINYHLLKHYVDREALWYVLLHPTPEKVEEFFFCRYVVLFAVGRSPHGNRLVGIVTHQVCHNLCD